MEYRVEKKYLLPDSELALLGKRLRTVMRLDSHQSGSCYQIKSVYFDDAMDSCMGENDAGVDDRQKYRIRTYGGAEHIIKLEIKEKKNGYTKKTGCTLSQQECLQLLHGNAALRFGERGTLNLLLAQMRCRGMKPKALITYERTAFVHPVGNVRITFDRNIMASPDYASFLKKNQSYYVPVLPRGMSVLEVKYDELLPDVLAQQLELGSLQQTAFSKYYLGRLALDGELPLV